MFSLIFSNRKNIKGDYNGENYPNTNCTWQSLGWFQCSCKFAISNWILLLSKSTILTNSQGKSYPLVESKSLLASGLANLRNKFETKCLSGKVLRIYHKCPSGWHQKKLTSHPRNYEATEVVADRFIPFNVLWITLREMSPCSELSRSVFLNTQHLSIFSPNPGKYRKIRTKITPNADTFYLVLFFWISCKLL